MHANALLSVTKFFADGTFFVTSALMWMPQSSPCHYAVLRGKQPQVWQRHHTLSSFLACLFELQWRICGGKIMKAECNMPPCLKKTKALMLVVTRHKTEAETMHDYYSSVVWYDTVCRTCILSVIAQKGAIPPLATHSPPPLLSWNTSNQFTHLHPVILQIWPLYKE